MNTKKARLDADKTAKPLTKLVGHAKEGGCIGPGIAPDVWRHEDGLEISLKSTRKRTDRRYAGILAVYSVVTTFAQTHPRTVEASQALMSFLQGDCEHFADEKDAHMCVLCGSEI